MTEYATFRGRIGVLAGEGGITAAIGTDEAALVLTDARPGIEVVSPGNAPAALRDALGEQGGGCIDWLTTEEGLTIGRVSSSDDRLLAMIAAPAAPTSSQSFVASLRETVERFIAAPCIVVAAVGGSDDSDRARDLGKSAGHAVLAALEAMTDPGTTLGHTSVVESGAPLAVWRPVPNATDSTIEFTADPVAGSWSVRLGAIALTRSADGALTAHPAEHADVAGSTR